MPLPGSLSSLILPPCASTRPLTIGKPRPEPSSAFFCAIEPRPNEDITVGISASGILPQPSFDPARMHEPAEGEKEFTARQLEAR